MKKLLFSFTMVICVLTTNAQMALNEVYVRPGNGQSEFFEIYNNAKTNININLDCFTALTYWKDGSNSRGWYVLDFAPTAIIPGGYFTAASASPFSTQGQTGIVAGLNWNALPAGASLTKWELNSAGTGYTTVPIVGALENFFEDVNGIGMKNIILMYKEGTFAQGFLAGSGSNVLPAEIISMPNLSVANLQGGCTTASFNFSGVSGSPFLYYANPAAGNDNGYSRLNDGNCAPWDKSASGNDHTPNATNNDNNGVSPYDGNITTAQVLTCVTKTSTKIDYNISGVTGAATEVAAFPVTIQFFTDMGTIGQYDPGVDVLLETRVENTIAEGPGSFAIASGSPAIIMLYTTANGCYDKVFSLTGSCITLPVDMKTFTATRSNSNVLLKWETTTEINSYGFMVERNINGTWQDVVFVPSQVVGGNSNSLLTYTLSDLNTAKGISQYRIRQIDIDGQFKFSEIRPVAGDGQKLKTVVYPNPSSDGRVNVLFEDSKNAKDILLMDAVGRTIKQWKTVMNNNLQIDNLSPGVYNLRIVVPATGEKSVERIIVAKQ